MNHKQKVKLARKMRTSSEAIAGVPLFSSVAWSARKYARAQKQALLRHNAIIRKRVRSGKAQSIMTHSRSVSLKSS